MESYLAMNDKNFEETVSLIKSWIKEGSFGDKEQHWCEIFLGVTLCPEARFFDKIYVPFPRKIIEGAAFKAGKTIFPMKSHGGFYDPSLNVFTEKFAFEVIIEKNFKGPLVLKDLEGLLNRYKGVDKIILGIHSEKRFDELTNIFHKRSDLTRFFTLRSLTQDFNSMPRENFKTAIKECLDRIENECSPHRKGIKNGILDCCIEDATQASEDLVGNYLVSGATNRIIISNRNFEYREGWMRDSSKGWLSRVEEAFLKEGRFTNV